MTNNLCNNNYAHSPKKGIREFCKCLTMATIWSETGVIQRKSDTYH